MLRKILTLIFIFNSGFIIAQSTDTSHIYRDTLTQEIMMYIKSQPFSKVDVHIAERRPDELISVKNDYRYVKCIPHPCRYNFKLSLQNKFTDEDIKILISNIQELARKETRLSENFWDRFGDSSSLIYPWYEIYDFMTKYKDWVI